MNENEEKIVVDEEEEEELFPCDFCQGLYPEYLISNIGDADENFCACENCM